MYCSRAFLTSAKLSFDDVADAKRQYRYTRHVTDPNSALKALRRHLQEKEIDSVALVGVIEIPEVAHSVRGPEYRFWAPVEGESPLSCHYKFGWTEMVRLFDDDSKTKLFDSGRRSVLCCYFVRLKDTYEHATPHNRKLGATYHNDESEDAVKGPNLFCLLLVLSLIHI